MKVRYQPPSPQPVWASSPLRLAPGPCGFASRPVVPSVPKNGLLSSPLCFYRVNSVLRQLNASFYCCRSCLTSCHQGHCLPWAPLLVCCPDSLHHSSAFSPPLLQHPALLFSPSPASLWTLPLRLLSPVCTFPGSVLGLPAFVTSRPGKGGTWWGHYSFYLFPSTSPFHGVGLGFLLDLS